MALVASFIENLIAAFRPLYEFFGKEPRLSRLILREMIFYESGPQAKRFVKTREKMIDLCGDIVRVAQSRNEAMKGNKYRRAGQVLFAVYQIEIRKWLMTPRSDVENGLQRLREALEIVPAGLSYKARS